MQLVKFCKPEHNIHQGAKLRVGTLHEYRSIENSELRDEAEGKYEFTIEFRGEVELDRRWANLLFQNIVGFGNTDSTPRFPGKISAKVEHLHMVEQKGENVVIKDTTAKIYREIPDCLIFCMSLLTKVDEMLFKDYQDNWNFPQEKANKFAMHIANLIMEQTKLTDFDDSISEGNSPNSIKGLHVNAMHREVIYQDRHLVITQQNMPSFEKFTEILLNIPFIKPPEPYSKEKEYRFVFELRNQERLFQPKSFILIPLNPLLEL